MKTVSVNIDWLNNIDGVTVEQAIEYLQTMPSHYILNYCQSSGDDQGVEITSDLSYKRPYTEEELVELVDIAVQRKNKKIKEICKSLLYYAEQRDYYKGKDTARSGSYQKDVERMMQKLEELQNPIVKIGA